MIKLEMRVDLPTPSSPTMHTRTSRMMPTAAAQVCEWWGRGESCAEATGKLLVQLHQLEPDAEQRIDRVESVCVIGAAVVGCCGWARHCMCSARGIVAQLRSIPPTTDYETMAQGYKAKLPAKAKSTTQKKIAVKDPKKGG